MGIRMRTLSAGLFAVVAFAFTGGVATAASAGQGAGDTSLSAMDYWQYHGHHQTHGECVAVGEEYLWPHNPGGADDYECLASGGGWNLWLIFGS
ncbi:hypothetical protein ACSDR0_36590 [Streptosporangium sp. G11]|uniref:hypothetical protein n=1 Tax=Streptosporangium sp. G11 TaxID=3436926 RepID=UPI003EBD9FB2